MTDDIDAIAVGDPVRVFDVNGKRKGQPIGGWEGTVIKIGRKLVTIPYGRTETVFRLDERRTNDAYGHQSFKTIARCELDKRYRVALNALNDHGIELSIHKKRLTIEQVEALAKVTGTF